MKLIWMSDLHVAEEKDVIGHDTHARLQMACDYINKYHSDAEICVISGDLVDRGTKTGYEVVRNHLEGLVIPYMPMVGNHDRRSLFCEMFQIPTTAKAPFVQSTRNIGDARIICLDTLDEGQDSGAFCQARRDWLKSELLDAADRSVYLFMHHPPMPLGLPMQDQDRMVYGDAFLDVLVEYSNIRHMFIGHVHRPICGTVRGIPFATLPAVSYQAPAPWPAWDWKSFSPAPEAPKMAVIAVNGGDAQVHYVEFCDYENGMVHA